jgi:hypothetical protein
VITFARLRALGNRPVAAPPPAPRLSDRAGDAITAHLVQSQLWRHDMQMELTRDNGRLSVRLFLPEHNQSDRELGRIEAIKVRHAVSQALTLNSHAVKFVDCFWQERGRKGWQVLVKARAL